MTNEEKIKFYRSKTIEELESILDNPNLEESDVIIASIEKQHKEDELGISVYYTMDEVREHIFGKNSNVLECGQ